MKKQTGFTLIELMIVVAIVAILAAIALPAYQTYTKKAHFTEVVAAVGGAKTSLELCLQTTSTFENCNVPTAAPNGITVTASGATSTAVSIIATAPNKSPFTGSEKYILSGTASGGTVSWSGTCSPTDLC